jgi:hypothetical protein
MAQIIDNGNYETKLGVYIRFLQKKNAKEKWINPEIF